MPWLSLALNKWTWIAIGFGTIAFYAAVQHIGWEASKAEYVTFKAAVAKEAADAKVKSAQEQARMAQNATEALSDLQVRHDTIAARYERLRKSGGGSMPACPAAPAGPGPVAGDPIEPDAVTRCLGVLEKGDRELAKFRELWLLDKANAKQP